MLVAHAITKVCEFIRVWEHEVSDPKQLRVRLELELNVNRRKR